MEGGVGKTRTKDLGKEVTETLKLILLKTCYHFFSRLIRAVLRDPLVVTGFHFY
jgi:hypothetical protein